MVITTAKLAQMIDLSKLHPTTTEDELVQFCSTVNRYRFAAAYVLPANLSFISQRINNGVTKIGTGIGFPFGTSTPMMKLLECEESIELGAQEIDVVINIGALKSGNMRLILRELQDIVGVAGPRLVKAILEVSYLTEDEIVEGARVCCDSGVSYVKTGTGFGGRPTTVRDVKLINRAIEGRVGIKAAGGVSNIDILLDMLRLGVDRFGVSAGDRIIDQFLVEYDGLFDMEQMMVLA